VRPGGDLAEGDFRRFTPRFQGENLAANVAIVERIEALAAETGLTPAQLALAWVCARGDDVIPIPGTKRRRYLEENVAATSVELTPDEVARLEAAVPSGGAAGERYPEPIIRTIDS
jgi:aryl-alcohol dehydrogenase-like predicted oxidoreductase